ncbi:MAG: VWA domain-containing protein [Chloroflexi bacterium]|nr:VWA domain-containing protein [Chloroflexota bacterium]
MGILIPAALALLALAIPIIVFYMLRLRREEFSVSSSLLWRRALQDRTANAPWQRLRRNLLLLLQLLLLLLLVFSLARPFLFTDAIAAGNIVVVLDGSASMQAADEAGAARRFDRARQEVGALIDGLQGNERMSLIFAGPSAEVLVQSSGDKAALHAALNGLTPSNGIADIVPAVTLAAASARQLGDATTVLISDGAFGQTSALPQVPGKAHYLSVGKSSRNIGITALSLRDAPAGPQLFAAILNSGKEPASALFSIDIDGKLRDSQQVDLAAGEEKTITLQDLPLDMQTAHARLSATDKAANALATDDEAWVLRPKPPPSSVLLVSENNSFLEKSLSLIPDARLFKAAPAQYAPSSNFGLTVFDAYMPPQLPKGNLLIFAPPSTTLTPVSGTIPYPVVGPVDVNDPLMRFVDLSGTHIALAQRIITPSWARVLARTTAGDPLILAGETNGRRVAVVAFDLHQSDLPLQVAFPILISNLVEWLQPSTIVDAPPTLRAGDAINIRALPEADEIIVTSPGGAGTQTSLRPAAQVSFAATDALGVYSVQQKSKGKTVGPPAEFAVNLFSREESDITPYPELTFAGTNDSPATASARRPLEIWPWVLLASLLLLSIEWWFYNRAGVPRRRWRRVAR